jgi:hypothetical protein
MAMATNERETGNLIGSDKVEGTAVYRSDNNNRNDRRDTGCSSVSEPAAALRPVSSYQRRKWILRYATSVRFAASFIFDAFLIPYLTVGSVGSDGLRY